MGSDHDCQPGVSDHWPASDGCGSREGASCRAVGKIENGLADRNDPLLPDRWSPSSTSFGRLLDRLIRNIAQRGRVNSDSLHRRSDSLVRSFVFRKELGSRQ